MNPADLPNASDGIERECPTCSAPAGTFCVSLKTGAKRDTTHRERKPRGDEP